MEIIRYKYRIFLLLDLAAWLMTYPWITVFSAFCSCYWSTSEERDRPLNKALQYALLGPLFGLLVATLFPVFLSGYVLWIILCYSTDHTNYTIVNFSSNHELLRKDIYTFVSANLLLGIEIIGKFQNMSLVYKRALKIADAMTSLVEDQPVSNSDILDDKTTKQQELLNSVVSSKFPDVDFFCLQEVWDRFFATILMRKLSEKFKHFVVDVSTQTFGSQLCMGSSGLMLVSKYPFLDVHFYKFKGKGTKVWMKLLDYGIIMAKVDLGNDSKSGRRRVGYFANLHMMAYQGKENLVGKAMTETRKEFNDFRTKTFNPNDDVVFVVIGGDFNVDNISPGDAPTRDHILFSDFIDYPMLNPGRDKSWSIGTEHRQLRMYDVELSSPCEMRKMMLDNVARRHYIIDADVKEQTTDLMFCGPQPNEEGEVCEDLEMGGRRRIDRIIYDATLRCKPSGFRFITSLAGQTDHVPIALSLKTQ